MTLRVGDVLRGEGNKSQKLVKVIGHWLGTDGWRVDLKPLSKHKHSLKTINRPVNPETRLPDGYVKDGEG